MALARLGFPFSAHGHAATAWWHWQRQLATGPQSGTVPRQLPAPGLAVRGMRCWWAAISFARAPQLGYLASMVALTRVELEHIDCLAAAGAAAAFADLACMPVLQALVLVGEQAVTPGTDEILQAHPPPPLPPAQTPTLSLAQGTKSARPCTHLCGCACLANPTKNVQLR